MSLSTCYLEYSRHVARLHRRRRRRAYAPTSDTASHDNYEKINSWVSFCFPYMGCLWGSAWRPFGPQELRYNPVHAIKIFVTGSVISRPPGISRTGRDLKTNWKGDYITLEIIPLWGIDYLTLHILLCQDNLKSVHWMHRVLACYIFHYKLKRCSYNLTTLSNADRNFTGKGTATQLTNTSYQCQWLQDTFVLIQLSGMLGTVWEWKFMEPNVSCCPY